MITKLSLFVLLVMTPLFALDDYFSDSLTAEKLILLDSVHQNFKLGGPRGKKLNIKRSHTGKRLYNYAAWLLHKGKSYNYVLDKLRTREDTFFPKESFSVASSITEVAGKKSAPIQVVAYITSTCPSCKKTGIPIHQLVNGPLEGRLSFILKPIHHKIGDYALLAADQQGKMWELFIEYGNLKSRLDDKTLFGAASKAGIDTTELKKDMSLNYERYRKQIAENHQEAKKNGLKTTPTLYFNGKRYRSNRHPLWIVDYVEFLEEEAKNPKKRKKKGWFK